LILESGYDGKKIIAGSIFSDKLIFGNECFRTTKINEVIEVLNRNSKGLEGLKMEKLSKKTAFPLKYPEWESNPHT
jgi:site-specific DNA recombinase